MFALARLMVVGFVVLTVIYVCLSLYSRAVRKGKLRAQWHEGPQEQTLGCVSGRRARGLR